jgi:site-specific recombinase XerD
MATFLNYLQSKGLSRETVKAYNYYLLDFISWTDAQGIDSVSLSSGDIMAYLHLLKSRELSNTSRNNHLIAIRHYMDWQMQSKARPDNPVQFIRLRGIKTRKLYLVLSQKELEHIYHQYEADIKRTDKLYLENLQRLTRQRNKVMLGLVIYQGLFTSEVNALTTKDLRLREGKLFVSGSRTSNERELELKPQQIIALMEYQLNTRKELLRYADQDSELLFLPAAPCGKKQSLSNDAQHTWKRLTSELKNQHPRLVNMLHIRTSVITLWLQQHDIRQVQYMAGHRYASTTEGYRVNQTEDLQQDIDQYHPFG